MTDDAGQVPGDGAPPMMAQAQDLIREITGLQTRLLEGGVSGGQQRAMTESVYRISPNYSVLIAASTVGSRFQRVQGRLPVPKGKRRQPFPRRELAKAVADVEDRGLVEVCLDVCEALMRGDHDRAHELIAGDLVASYARGLDALALMLVFGLLTADMAVQFSPMLRSRQDLIQREALEMETQYLDGLTS